MRIAYIDCFSGVSGDMLLAALIDAGADASAVEAGINSLRISPVDIAVSRVRVKGISSTRIWIESKHDGELRNLRKIEGILNESTLPGWVRDRSLETFRRLAAAEAKVHGVPVEEVHFHEVGAMDTIVDVVGCFLALHLLKIDRVVASHVPWNRGYVALEHGTYPVPAPATAELLRGVPCYGCEAPIELVTPTGAALLLTMAEDFGPLPVMSPLCIGYGAGHQERPDVPNVLRVIIGDSPTDVGVIAESVDVLETQIDDMSPEFYSFLGEKLGDSVVLDYYYTPVYMKKGRPATLVTVITPAGRAREAARVLLTHTSTLGVRYRSAARLVLEREMITVATKWGEVRVKVAYVGGRGPKIAPEFEDCRAIACAHDLPLDTVYQEAVSAAVTHLALAKGAGER